MTRTRATLMAFLKNVLDFEHWLDARLPFAPVKELQLENFWPLETPNPDAVVSRVRVDWLRHT